MASISPAVTQMAQRGRNRQKNMAAIEAEFGEPVHETIQGMRGSGYNWITIAGALDINVFTLFKWRKLFGMDIDRAKRIRNKTEQINDL